MKNKNIENNKLLSALAFRENGFSIIPLLPKDKKPWGKWSDRQETKMSMGAIKKHWALHPDANVGIVTGKISNIIVFDCDSKEAIEQFENILGGKPATYIVKTANGAHYYFRYPKSKNKCPNRAAVLPKIDIRGDGGYVVAAGSIHPTGAIYEEEQAIDEIGVAECPHELLKFWRQEQDYTEKKETDNSDMPTTNKFTAAMHTHGVKLNSKYNYLLAGVSEGRRNDCAARLVGVLIKRGVSGESLIELMRLWNANNRPPLSDKELLKTVISIKKRDIQNTQRSTHILKNLDILGIDEDGKAVFYSKDTRVAHHVDLPRLTYSQAVQIVGEEFCENVTYKEQDNGITFSAWKQEIILQARKCQIGGMQKCGQGVWKTEHDDVLLIVNGNYALIYDGKHFKKHYNPVFEDKFIEFSAGKTWVDDNTRRLAENMTQDQALAIINDLRTLIEQWGFKQDIDYDLIEGFIISRFIQGTWKWQPHMWLSGPAGCGKSKLLELIHALSGPLAITQQGKVTEAAIRQSLMNNLYHVNIDEFEKSPKRDRVIELIRTANRGGVISKGTPSGKVINYYVRHMFIVASIEVGLVREAENTRFIVVEWEKDTNRNPILPSTGEIDQLRQGLTAVALWAANNAHALVSQIKTYKGVEGRMMESYAVPLVFRVIAEGGELDDLDEKTHAVITEKERERPQMETDEGKLLEDIALARIRTDDGEYTVAQLIKKGIEKEQNLNCYGIKALNFENMFERRIFIAPDIVRRNLLQNTRWRDLQIRDILKRCHGARQDRRRLGGKNIRGINIPWYTFFGE